MPEEADDLPARLRRAVTRLEEHRDRPGIGPFERARLEGKVEGVKLAAAYLNEDHSYPESRGQ